MKLSQMLKLTKLRKLLSRKPKKEPIKEHLFGLAKGPSEFESNEEFCEELSRKDKIGEALAQIMTDYREQSGAMNPIPSFKGVGISLGQLSTFPPTQVRNLRKCFSDKSWQSGYSDQTLDALLVEFQSGAVGFIPVCRKSTPTVLITKRPEYRRKVNGEYPINSTPIIPSVANGRVVIS